MRLELPPKGTRGSELPKPLRPVARATTGIGNIMFRLGMKIQGRPLLRLTTIGARTGQKRRTVLGWFPDEDREGSWLIVASNAGSARHPAWAHNLAKHPDRASIETRDGGSVDVMAEQVTGPEREQIWSRIAAQAPGYEAYTTKTDRELPVFRLSARQ